MISQKTLLKAIKRVLLVGLVSMAAVFVNMPVDTLLQPENVKKTILIPLIAGFIAGVQKAIKGYIRYDK